MSASPPEVRTKDLLKSAAHQNPALTSKGVLERLFTFWFDSFVYNQIWEDPQVDLEALELQPDSKVLTISSGGCNVLHYLIANPAEIHAVDLNRNHLALLKLKLAALTHLPTHEDFFLFFGCADQPKNLQNYHHFIANHLDPETRFFWEKGSLFRRLFLGPRIHYFTKNFYNYAKLGYFLRFLHTIAWWLDKNPKALLAAKSREEQEHFYQETIEPWFDHWVIRAGGKLPLALYSLGIPPQQFQSMEGESNQDMIQTLKERVHRLACDFPVQENYFCWQAFARSYDQTSRKAIPEYLKEEHFKNLRSHVDRVHVHLTTTTNFLREQRDQSLDRFVFLDSQDWMSQEQITTQWAEVARVGKPGSRIIFRTAAAASPIETELPPSLRERFVYEKEVSQALFKKDRSAIYGGFHLYSMPQSLGNR